MDKKNALSKTQVIPELSPSEYGEELSAGENFNVSRVKKVKRFFQLSSLAVDSEKDRSNRGDSWVNGSCFYLKHCIHTVFKNH